MAKVVATSHVVKAALCLHFEPNGETDDVRDLNVCSRSQGGLTPKAGVGVSEPRTGAQDPTQLPRGGFCAEQNTGAKLCSPRSGFTLNPCSP